MAVDHSGFMRHDASPSNCEARAHGGTGEGCAAATAGDGTDAVVRGKPDLQFRRLTGVFAPGVSVVACCGWRDGGLTAFAEGRLASIG